jgi:flagellar protein FliO/FliZ
MTRPVRSLCARVICGCVALWHALGVAAAAQTPKAFAAPTTGESTASGLLEITLALLLVLAVIFGVAWLARRAKWLGTGHRGRIELVGDLALGVKERAVLVRVNGIELLLGVAPGSVRALHTFAPTSGESTAIASLDIVRAAGSEVADKTDNATPRALTFAELLRRSLGR